MIGLHAPGVSPAELEQFAQEHHLTYPQAIDAPDDRDRGVESTFRQYGVKGLPSVAVIDRSGRVAYLGHFLSEAIGSLGPLLASPSPAGEEKCGLKGDTGNARPECGSAPRGAGAAEPRR